MFSELAWRIYSPSELRYSILESTNLRGSAALERSEGINMATGRRIRIGLDGFVGRLATIASLYKEISIRPRP